MLDNHRQNVFSADQIERAIGHLAQGILRDCPGGKQLVLIGIATGGVPLAKRLLEKIIEGGCTPEPKLGELDITFYRDDLALRDRQPVVKRTKIPFNLDQTYTILVDDVLFSGRTTRAAMDALVEFGRPDVTRLAVLVDRGHRELPIRADFIGEVLPTDRKDKVSVFWQALGAESDEVRLEKRDHA